MSHKTRAKGLLQTIMESGSLPGGVTFYVLLAAIIDALPEEPQPLIGACTKCGRKAGTVGGYCAFCADIFVPVGPEPVEVKESQPTSAFPQQPIVTEANGVRHFKENTMIRFILKRSTENMNTLADAPFTNEERRQFAQLIGYTVDGYNELSYVEDADLGPHSDPPATATPTK